MKICSPAANESLLCRTTQQKPLAASRRRSHANLCKLCCCRAAKSAPAGPDAKQSMHKPRKKSRDAVNRPELSTQHKRSHKVDQRFAQEMEDLAAVRQGRAKSASRQVSKFSGLQRAVKLRGKEPMPEPYATTVRNSLVSTTSGMLHRLPLALYDSALQTETQHSKCAIGFT